MQTFLRVFFFGFFRISDLDFVFLFLNSNAVGFFSAFYGGKSLWSLGVLYSVQPMMENFGEGMQVAQTQPPSDC